jgi:transposase
MRYKHGRWQPRGAQVEAAVAKVPLLRMKIVKRSDDTKGFVVLPRRWVVERTLDPRHTP